jgi:hypothetical protein
MIASGKIVSAPLKTAAKTLSALFLLTMALTFIDHRQAQASNFGALAYDPASGASGYSYDYASEQDANLRAVAECAKHGSRCAVVMRFANECAAYARSANGDAGWGTAWTKRAAESVAMAYCKKYGHACQVVTSACSSLPAPSGNRNPNQPWSPSAPNTYDQMMRECLAAGGGNLNGSTCVRY